MNFQDAKLVVMNTTGLEKDALHIYVGLGVYLGSMALLRLWITYPLKRKNLALVLVVLAALAGEILDLRGFYPTIRGVHLAAGIHDFLNTCFWPCVLYAVSRWTTLLE